MRAHGRTSRRRRVACRGRPVSLIILAGGRSRRMGRSKALLPLAGGTLLEHILGQVEGYFDDILISISPGQGRRLAGIAAGRDGRERPRPIRPAPPVSIRLVEDARPGQGPMAGILAGLKAARHDVCAVIACDIPDVDLGVLRRLAGKAGEGYDAVIPVTSEGLLEPLFAVYRREVIPRMEELLDSGERSLLPLFNRVRTRRVVLTRKGLINLNTPRDYRSYLRTRSSRA